MKAAKHVMRLMVMGADVNRHSHRRYNRTHARVACSATYDGTRPIDTVYYGYSKESLEWLPGLVLLGRRVLGYTVFNIRFTLAGRKKIRRSCWSYKRHHGGAAIPLHLLLTLNIWLGLIGQA